MIASSAGTTYTLINAPGGVSASAQNDFYLSGDTNARQTYIWGSNGADVTLTVFGAAHNLIWTGTGGIANTWDTNTSPNWFNVSTGSADIFYIGDNVTFNDSAGSSHANVLINSTVQPGSVTFSNSAVSYTLSGTGSIAGPISLAMNGPGTLTIANSNSYTGGTMINAGTLKAANAYALPSGPAAGDVVLGGAGTGILDLNGTTVIYINGLSGGGGTAGPGDQ